MRARTLDPTWLTFEKRDGILDANGQPYSRIKVDIYLISTNILGYSLPGARCVQLRAGLSEAEARAPLALNSTPANHPRKLPNPMARKNGTEY
jgi:hypothetical protein